MDRMGGNTHSSNTNFLSKKLTFISSLFRVINRLSLTSAHLKSYDIAESGKSLTKQTMKPLSQCIICRENRKKGLTGTHSPACDTAGDCSQYWARTTYSVYRCSNRHSVSVLRAAAGSVGLSENV